jgi:hypothetical protein
MNRLAAVFNQAIITQQSAIDRSNGAVAIGF